MQHETFERAQTLRSMIEKLQKDKEAMERLIAHVNAHDQGEAYLGFYDGNANGSQRYVHCSPIVLAYWQKAIDIELKIAQETFENL